MSFKWRAGDGSTLNAGQVYSFEIFQGIWASIAKEAYSFVIFGEGVGSDPRSLSGSAHGSIHVAVFAHPSDFS